MENLTNFMLQDRTKYSNLTIPTPLLTINGTLVTMLARAMGVQPVPPNSS